MAEELDPQLGAFRWAIRVTLRRRSLLEIGVIAGVLAGVVAGSLTVPQHPTWQQRLANGAVGAAIAVAAVLAALFIVNLVDAPRQQRNALRKVLADVAPTGGQHHPLHQQLISTYEVGKQLADTQVTSDEELEQLRIRFRRWTRDTDAWLRNDHWTAFAIEFSSMTNLIGARYMGAYNEDHNTILLRLNRHLANLEALITRLG